MGYGTNGLTFNALRGANKARLRDFRNARGNIAHAAPDGSDWSLAQWMNATLGELGEAANIIKKIDRGDYTLEEARESLAKEFADVNIYLDIAAMRAGIDLGAATLAKFNEVSERVGSCVRLTADAWHLHEPGDAVSATSDAPSAQADDELPGMLAVAKGVAEQKWPHTMDALQWAEEWAKQIAKTPDIATDEGAMLGWFANAIMAGYDTAQQRDAQRIATLEQESTAARQALRWLDERGGLGSETHRRIRLATPGPRPPYPEFCHHFEQCALAGRCTREICCAD